MPRRATQAVRVGKARVGRSGGKRIPGYGGRITGDPRGGLTDAALAEGSKGHGRSAPGTGLSGFGGGAPIGTGPGAPISEETRPPGGDPIAPAPPSAPQDPYPSPAPAPAPRAPAPAPTPAPRAAPAPAPVSRVGGGVGGGLVDDYISGQMAPLTSNTRVAPPAAGVLGGRHPSGSGVVSHLAPMPSPPPAAGVSGGRHPSGSGITTHVTPPPKIIAGAGLAGHRKATPVAVAKAKPPIKPGAGLQGHKKAPPPPKPKPAPKPVVKKKPTGRRS